MDYTTAFSTAVPLMFCLIGFGMICRLTVGDVNVDCCIGQGYHAPI